MSSAYLWSMIARLITTLAILAITVVTTVTSAHAARMSVSMTSGPDYATHVGEMIHSPGSTDLACDSGQYCGSADAEMCEFVCAGLSAFLSSPGADAGHAHGPVSHDFPSEASHVSRAPGLNERPPKLRLL